MKKETFTLWYGQDDTSGYTGWNCKQHPEFDAVNPEGAYLLGHDLLEHFDMVDCTICAELFASGAMVYVRGPDYFGSLRNDRRLSNMSFSEILKNGIKSDLGLILEQIQDDYLGEKEANHIEGLSTWYQEALSSKQKLKEEDSDEYENIHEAISKAMLELITSNPSVFESSEFSENDAESIKEKLLRASEFVYLGAYRAKQKYPRGLAMYDIYKSITRLIQELQEFTEVLIDAWEVELELEVDYEEGKIKGTFSDPEIHHFIQSQLDSVYLSESELEMERELD